MCGTLHFKILEYERETRMFIILIFNNILIIFVNILKY